jgi:ABC-type branched-subunit amino acid transport system ATPase component
MTQAQASSPLLMVRDLGRDFGGVRAVDGASFDVSSNQITGLIGPNGAGKSTALAIIAGALPPSRGSILFEGTEIAGQPVHKLARRGIVRTFQLPKAFERLTVLENLLAASPRQRGESLLGSLAGKRWWQAQERDMVRRARDLLDRFELSHHEDEYGGNLSGGQKRLLEIARALMADPRLLVLDEPFAGINPQLAKRIGGYLEDLRRQGITMLMVEHEMAAVERLCDSLVVMAQGRVIAEGSVREVRSRQEVRDAYLTG